MKKLYKVSKCYSTYTEESIEAGDSEDNGFDYEDNEFDLSEVLEELRYCCLLSSFPVNPGNCAEDWDNDYETGESTEHTYHIHEYGNKPVSSRRLYRIYKMLGLIR